MTHKVVVSPDWYRYIGVSSLLCCSSSWALRKWEKREKRFFSDPFRSLEKKKKIIHLKDKEFKRFDTEPTRKQSEIRNSSERETCARQRARLSLPPVPHSHCFSFGRTGCVYRAQSTSGDFIVGLWASAYSDPSSRNRTKKSKKTECSIFQTYHSYSKINNNPAALFGVLFVT